MFKVSSEICYSNGIFLFIKTETFPEIYGLLMEALLMLLLFSIWKSVTSVFMKNQNNSGDFYKEKIRQHQFMGPVLWQKQEHSIFFVVCAKNWARAEKPFSLWLNQHHIL